MADYQLRVAEGLISGQAASVDEGLARGIGSDYHRGCGIVV